MPHRRPLALGTWAWLRFTYVGKALRAAAEDPAIAAAFGVNHRGQALLLSGVSAAYAGIAGAFIALISTLAPSQIWAWVGVVFAVDDHRRAREPDRRAPRRLPHRRRASR